MVHACFRFVTGTAITGAANAADPRYKHGMLKRTFTGFCVAFALAACGMVPEADDQSLVLRAAYVADDGIALAAPRGREAVVMEAVHIGLTAREPGGRVIPSLATSWRVSEDGRSYIFKLREAYWSDGRRMTAGDVVAVMRRIVSPGSTSPLKDQLWMIVNAGQVAANRKPARMLGVEDPRSDTVVFTLSQPEPALLELLASPAAAIVRSRGESTASAAFAVLENGDEPVRLVKNTTYYAADSVAIDAVELHQSDAENAIRKFRDGEYDLVSGGRIGGLRTARTVDAASLRLEPAWGIYYYLARTTSGPLADVRLRRALSMSIDRANILSRLFGVSGIQPAFGALPPTLPDAYAGSTADWALWTPDARRAEAVRLLAEAGYSMDRPLEIAVAIPHGREHAELLAEITAYWGAIGVRVKAYSRGAIPHRQAIEKGDYDLALVEHITTAPVAQAFLMPFTCGERMSGYCNPAADRLIDEAAALDDPGTRIQLLRRANRLISEDAPLIAILSPVRWSLVSPRIGGWEDNIAGAHPLSRLTIGLGEEK